MSTNRPFFSNFLSVFRARSGFQNASTSPAGGVSGASLTKAQSTAAASILASSAAASASTSATQGNTSPSSTTRATQSASPPTSMNSAPLKATATTTSVSAHGVPYQRQHHHTSPYSRSPGTSPGPARGFRSGTMNTAPTTTNQATSRRRGSDSSSEGFREILGSEKWYIGGRTAAGEEKFYRLGMVRRPRSIDRLSADRLSL